MAANTRRSDDSVERYLEDDSDLSRLYNESPKPEPPLRLVEAVQTAARQEAARRAAGSRRFWVWLDGMFLRLRLPMAALASVMLVVVVSLTVLHEHGDEGPLSPGFDQPMGSPSPSGNESLQPKSLTLDTPAGSAAEDFEQKSLPFDLGNEQTPSAEAWLDDIRVLLKHGKIGEAKEELQAFLKANPGHALPKDMQNLAGGGKKDPSSNDEATNGSPRAQP